MINEAAKLKINMCTTEIVKNPNRPKTNFFLHLRIYNFKCLQGKISQEPNIFFSFMNLQFQMPARKNTQEPNIFFFIYESTISNACKEKYHKSQTFFFSFTNLQFQMLHNCTQKVSKKKNTKESFSSVFGYSPRP